MTSNRGWKKSWGEELFLLKCFSWVIFHESKNGHYPAASSKAKPNILSPFSIHECSVPLINILHSNCGCFRLYKRLCLLTSHINHIIMHGATWPLMFFHDKTQFFMTSSWNIFWQASKGIKYAINIFIRLRITPVLNVAGICNLLHCIKINVHLLP